MRLNQWIFTSALCAIVCVLDGTAEPAARSEPVSRIHFGSCIDQAKPVPIIKTILDDRPEMFVFLGDNIYADTEDMSEMEAKYAMLKAKAGFSALLAACPIKATWDDHDYGVNDGGAGYSMKKESQKIFMDFWGDADDSERRRHEGIYESSITGPEGKRLQIILLDTRYFRGALKKGERRVGGPYYPNPDASVPMLGDAQWRWLERQFRKPAELRMVVSSIQFIAEAAGQETWSNLPIERQRMIDLIAKTGASGVLFISGDRHWVELSAQTVGVPYPLYDLTSSSLNKPHARGTPTENRYRVIDKTWHQENFGTITIDWEAGDPVIELRIQDIENKTRLEKRLRLSELRAKGRGGEKQK